MQQENMGLFQSTSYQQHKMSITQTLSKSSTSHLVQMKFNCTFPPHFPRFPRLNLLSRSVGNLRALLPLNDRILSADPT